jgi:hypothetical protein
MEKTQTVRLRNFAQTDGFFVSVHPEIGKFGRDQGAQKI